jgi:hypothetical protein
LEHSDSRVRQIATADSFTELEKSRRFSLPTRCRVEYFQYADSEVVSIETPLFTEHYTVTRLEQEPIDEREFVLVYKTPGTTIADGTLPGAERAPDGQITYQVPIDPHDLDRVIELAMKKYAPSVWLPLFAGTFIAGVLLFVAWWLYRRRTSH